MWIDLYDCNVITIVVLGSAFVISVIHICVFYFSDWNRLGGFGIVNWSELIVPVPWVCGKQASEYVSVSDWCGMCVCMTVLCLYVVSLIKYYMWTSITVFCPQKWMQWYVIS